MANGTDPYRIDICLHAKRSKEGVSHVKLPSEGYRAFGGFCSYSIAVSLHTVATRAAIYRSLRAPIAKKSQKACFRGSAEKSQYLGVIFKGVILSRRLPINVY